MHYLQWNERIARHFFNPRNAGKPVYLAVSKRLIERLAAEESDFPDFIRSLKYGPSWSSGKSSICDKALKAWTGWRERRLEFPPSIGYLSLFVLAVEEETPEHGPLAYHNPLRKLLGEPAQVNRPYPRFDRMIELWDDLEAWSREDKQGQLGLFKYNFAGNHIHVGIPKEQFLASTLMADRDRVCPHCNQLKSIDEDFGWRKINGKPVPQSWCYMCRSGSWRNAATDTDLKETHTPLEPIVSKPIERTLGRSLRLVPRLRFLPGQRAAVTLVARRYETMPQVISLGFDNGEILDATRFHACWYSDISPQFLGRLLLDGGRAIHKSADNSYTWKLLGRKVIVFRAGEQVSGFIQNSGGIHICHKMAQRSELFD